MQTAVWLSVIASVLWGFGFIAAIWALPEVGPFALCFARFALASTLLIPALFFKFNRKFVREHYRLAFWPGVFFASTLLAQTWGLEYTTATKSGFITTLYVVFMPFLESTIGRRALGGKLWLSVGTAFFGTLLIVNVGLNALNLGDVLTLLCALLATGQIYLMGRVAQRVAKPFLFNLMQSAWGALICLPFVLNAKFWTRAFEFPQWSRQAQIGMLALGFGSTVIAFGLQVKAQKSLPPTLSSLLFLLESPFAMLFAVWLLDERLSTLEISGALLITGGAVLACLPEKNVAFA